jgi:uncharacterized protein with PQ loop repeat
MAPAVAAAAVVVVIDAWLGAGFFGVAAIIPGTIVNVAQSVELVRSRSVAGVSVVFLVLAAVNQLLWLSWALLVPEWGTIIAASVALVIVTFNVLWWGLRRLGVRAFWAHELAPVVEPGYEASQ